MTKIDLSKSSSEETTLRMLNDMYPGKFTLTVKETAAVLGVSDDFVYIRLKNNTIQGTRQGSKWAIPFSVVAKLITKGVS